MKITYTASRVNITGKQLQRLFQSVKWKSARYPDQLLQAISGSHSVITAWDGHELVGLVNAISDGCMTAYFHYMLVDPAYQGQGIGRELMRQMLARYDAYETKVLIAYPEVIRFYESMGFKTEKGTVPLYISSLI